MLPPITTSPCAIAKWVPLVPYLDKLVCGANLCDDFKKSHLAIFNTRIPVTYIFSYQFGVVAVLARPLPPLVTEHGTRLLFLNSQFLPRMIHTNLVSRGTQIWCGALSNLPPELASNVKQSVRKKSIA